MRYDAVYQVLGVQVVAHYHTCRLTMAHGYPWVCRGWAFEYGRLIVFSPPLGENPEIRKKSQTAKIVCDIYLPTWIKEDTVVPRGCQRGWLYLTVESREMQ
jgi:hypothetical protein